MIFIIILVYFKSFLEKNLLFYYQRNFHFVDFFNNFEIVRSIIIDFKFYFTPINKINLLEILILLVIVIIHLFNIYHYISFKIHIFIFNNFITNFICLLIIFWLHPLVSRYIRFNFARLYLLFIYYYHIYRIHS